MLQHEKEVRERIENIGERLPSKDFYSFDSYWVVRELWKAASVPALSYANDATSFKDREGGSSTLQTLDKT